jgi:hypothetical protein
MTNTIAAFGWTVPKRFWIRYVANIPRVMKRRKLRIAGYVNGSEEKSVKILVVKH